MVDYDFKGDIILIRQCLGLSQQNFASAVGLSRSNIARYEAGEIVPRKDAADRIYGYSYTQGFDINRSKSMLWEDDRGERLLLFHGAKGEIIGQPDTSHSVPPNDFSSGFYLGQTYEQATSWVAAHGGSSVYSFYFCPDPQFESMAFGVDRQWMEAILYYRGALEGYEIPLRVKKLIEGISRCDYLIVPIADNQMYDTLELFRNNLISDVACLHALNANNLGSQYVMKSEKACRHLTAIDRLYLCEQERNAYLVEKEKTANEGKNKSQLAIAKYRKEGKLFHELFTEER